MANGRRPKVSENCPTVGLDAAELDRLLTPHRRQGGAASMELLAPSSYACSRTASGGAAPARCSVTGTAP